MKGIRTAPYFFIAPTMLLILVFSILPIGVALVISFTNTDMAGLGDMSEIRFVGFSNYMEVLRDPTFLKSILNTLFYVVIGVPAVIVFSLAVAVLINFGKSKIFHIFRLVYYIPSVTNIVAIAVIWGYLYNPSVGLFNFLLGKLHLGPLPWLQDPVIAKLSLIMLAVWRNIGLNMIIFIAAIRSIPKDYYEAAELDGASSWRQLTSITVPMLSYAIFFVSITTMIGWLQFFEEPFIMTKGGPLDSTTSVSLFIYRNGFQLSNFGYAAAGSFILFFAIMAVTIFQFKLQRKDMSI